MFKFQKLATGASGIMESAGKLLGKAKDIGHGAASGIAAGLKDVPKDTIGKHLNLEGRHHLYEGYKAMQGAGNLKDKAHAFAHGLGKAAPSLAAGAAYAYGAKKVYDKLVGNNQEPPYGY